MNVRQAVGTAKEYVTEVFADEGISPPTLEEVEFDEPSKEWTVTVGFYRKQRPRTLEAVARMMGPLPPLFDEDKEYKIVRIQDENGKPIAIKNREMRQ
jgi:hypothetical protein